VQTGTLDVNLVQNPGAEMALVGGQNPFWTGAGWTRCGQAFEGAADFCGGFSLPSAELRQDVDVSPLASNIDNGFQSFAFELYYQSTSETIPDTSRVLVEFRDAANTSVLSSYDSGAVVNVGSWARVADTRIAPAGTRWVRIRFILTRRSGCCSDGAFDSVSLRAIDDLNPFVFPPNETIAGKQRKTLLVTADLPSGSGTIQASVLNGLDLTATYGLETASVSGAPVTGNAIPFAPRIEITSPAANSTFKEGTQITITATARNEFEDVAAMSVQVSGVPANQISLIYSPTTPAPTRTVTAILTLPTIAANGSNQVTITVTSNDGTAVNSASIPITLIP
jgi:Bacterial Ig domain